MLSFQINNIGKKFGSEWIFRNVNDLIGANDKVVILGGNGSGKSTLLQVISGYVTPNEGTIEYELKNSAGKISPEAVRNYVSFASPYLQLIEDLTLTETIEHSSVFKPFINKLSVNEVIEITELSSAKDKYIKQFSSGMKQRLKLSLAILADTPLLLMDEPVSNLDKNAVKWYQNLLNTYSANRTVMICSNNIEEEYFICTRQINVSDHKPKK